MLTFDQSWANAETASQQAENAKREMQDWRKYEVYTVFVDIARRLAEQGAETIVDLGCGAGQYRALALRAAGLRKYHGIDNPFAVAEARTWHDAADFTTDLTPIPCDILLCAASIEYAANPPLALATLIEQWPCRWVMLHRVRFHDQPGAFVEEPSWGGTKRMWRWNQAELERQLAEYNVNSYQWGEQWTYLIEPW